MIHQFITNFSGERASNCRKPFQIGTIALALTTMFLGAACTNNLEARRAEGENNVTAQEVADNTVQLVGKTVTIRSQPVRKISPTTFTVSDQQFFGSEPILVVNATGSVAPLPENIDLENSMKKNAQCHSERSEESRGYAKKAAKLCLHHALRCYPSGKLR